MTTFACIAFGVVVGFLLKRRLVNEEMSVKAWGEGFQLGRASGLEDAKKEYYRALFEAAELERISRL